MSIGKPPRPTAFTMADDEDEYTVADWTEVCAYMDWSDEARRELVDALRYLSQHPAFSWLSAAIEDADSCPELKQDARLLFDDIEIVDEAIVKYGETP